MKKQHKESKNSFEENNFQWAIWITLIVENWILDFGRPIAMVRHLLSGIN